MDASTHRSAAGKASSPAEKGQIASTLMPTSEMVHYRHADDLPQEISADNWGHLASLCRKYMGDADAEKAERAYCFAAEKHSDQKRRSGELYINHPVEVAIILAELKMDCDVVCAALLHDTVEDTETSLGDVASIFGDTVADLVDGVTKLTNIEVGSMDEKQALNLRKMFLAMSRDIRVVIYDGKMHPVDSNELSFMLAARHAFSDAFKQAGPKILEPIYDLEVYVPADYMGDVMSDLQGRRAMIMGMDSEAGYQKLQAKIPLKELSNYSIALSSLTGGRASFSTKFASYELVPNDIQQKLIAEHEAEQKDED